MTDINEYKSDINIPLGPHKYQFKHMKNIFFLLALMLVLTTSCKKDDCEPGTLSSTIVGEWSVHTLGVNSGDVEFRADGTLIDPDDALIGGESGTGEPFDQKSYVVNGDTSFEATATDGNNSVSFEFEVTDYSCDEIHLDVLGFESTLRRK